MTLCWSPRAEEPSGILPSPHGLGPHSCWMKPSWPGLCQLPGLRLFNTSIEQGQLTHPFFREMWVMVEHEKWIFMAFGKKKKKFEVLIPPKSFEIYSLLSKKSEQHCQIFLKRLNCGSLPHSLHWFWYEVMTNHLYPHRINLHIPISMEVQTFKGKKPNNVKRPQEDKYLKQNHVHEKYCDN